MEPENIKSTATKLGRELAHVIAPDEELILNIHQHAIVLLKQGFLTILACLVFLGSAGYLVKSASAIDNTTARLIIIMLASVTIFVMAIVLYVIAIAYKQTVLVITNCSVVQVVQKGLLFHKVGRLSMADVEDVSSEQKGILPRLFGYGTCTIQTAGELPNFIFKYCTNPIKVTEVILDARDQYNHHNGHSGP